MVEAWQTAVNEIDRLLQSETDPDAQRQLEADRTRYIQQIEAHNRQEIVEEAQNPESSYYLKGVDFRRATKGDDEYAAITAAVRLTIAEMQQDFRAVKSTLEATNAHNEALIQNFRDQVHHSSIERDDYKSKWEAATAALTERENEIETLQLEAAAYVREIESLKAQVSELQNAVQTPAEIDSYDQLNDAIARLKAKQEEEDRAREVEKEAAKPRIYGVRPMDAMTTGYLANLALTDEQIIIKPHWDINKYVVLTDEEAARFREEHQAQEPMETSIELVEAPAIPDFREDVEPETFEESTRRRLELLEAAVFGTHQEAKTEGAA